VERPFEFGADRPKHVRADPAHTLHARNFIHLAELLGC
jgi:2-haloacid dehalogenase